MASSKTSKEKATEATPKAPQQGVEATKKASKAPEKATKGAAAKKAAKKGKNGKPGFIERAKAYFKGVRSEVKRVVWPTKPEMVKYTGAVLGMLIFFGILIALVDAVVVPALYAFSGLR